MKDYLSGLTESLPDWEVCEAAKKKVPAWAGESLQLDSLPPLLMCLIKCYKNNMKSVKHKA